MMIEIQILPDSEINGFKRGMFLSRMDNIQWWERGMCEIPDRFRQGEYFPIPLSKRHTFELFGNGTKIDRMRKASL